MLWPVLLLWSGLLRWSRDTPSGSVGSVTAHCRGRFRDGGGIVFWVHGVVAVEWVAVVFDNSVVSSVVGTDPSLVLHDWP